MIEALTLIRTTPRLTAVIPIVVPRDDIRQVMGPGLAELRAAVAAQKVSVTGPWFTHHRRDPGAVFDFEIGLPVAGPVEPAGRMRPGAWPAMTVARTVYHGGYDGLGTAWGTFVRAIQAAGHATADDLWECYLVGPDASADPSAWRTELSKPLAGV